MRRGSPARQADGTGLALLESLIALLVVTVALLLGLRLAVVQPRAVERLEAGEAALGAIEAALETIRAGALPLEPGALLPPAAYSATPETADLRLTLEVVPREPAGLFEVAVEARYLVRREIHHRRVETLVWRPE